nr:movement protein [Grapevine virus H]
MQSKEVKVFKVKPSTSNFGELNKQLSSQKVYDISSLEKLFPKSIIKGNVHAEIIVKNGKVDVELDLLGPDGSDALVSYGKPYVHVGCIAIALMPHGRDLNGAAHLVVRDGRMLSGKDVLCRFQCDLKKRLSAFADFPNYFVSTEDVLQGFSFHLGINADDLSFRDGTHPFSIEITTILRGCDESMDMRYALSTLGSGAYQAILNTKTDGGESQLIKYQPNDVTSVMPEVYETIKKLNLGHNGKLHKERSDERGDKDAPTDWSDSG